MARKTFLISGFALVLILSSCRLSVNRSIYVDDGSTVHNGLITVNGNIEIGDDCEIRGDCRTVNGGIQVGSGSRVRDLQTVNGDLDIERDVIIRGNIGSVNGRVEGESGIEIRGDISTVNGTITLDNTRVREIRTYNGDILLSEGTVVSGDVIIRKTRGRDRDHREHPILIEVTGGSRIKGDVVVEDRRVEVEVALSDGGEVEGEIINAEVIREDEKAQD